MELMPPDAAGPASQYEMQTAGAMGIDPDTLNGNLSAVQGPFVRVDEPPKFELETYIANYTGRTRFNRLFLIGTCSTYLAADALKAAVAEAKSGKDVSRYERAVQALTEISQSEAEAVIDREWAERSLKVVKTETDRLEHELKGYKNNLIKESIRMGNEDLGQHYHQVGDLASAFKAYSRMRDFCTTPSHIASMLFKIISVAIERGDWLSVQSHVQRLRSQQLKQEEVLKNQPKQLAAMGLSQLHSGSYIEAANSFLAAEPSLGDSYNEIISSNDVAVYGGLCALASMDRNELQRRVIDNSSFRNFLELEPHIRRAISFFCNSKFRPCLEILEAYRADYLLDIHLQRHVHTLYTRIRTKSIQQYLIPFNRVSLDSMAKIFVLNPTTQSDRSQKDSTSAFVQELISLIQDGTLDARIDLEKNVLVSSQADKRVEVQEATLNSLDQYVHEAHLRLLRANIVRAGLEVRPLGKNEDRRGKEERGGKRNTFGNLLSRATGMK
ncbi:CSN complex subunit 1 [Aspergillus californicus]